MQIMEDVREGCNIQPSSPGHAEERTVSTPDIKTDTLTENGYSNDNSNKENNVEENAQKEDSLPDDVKVEIETLESIKTEVQSESNQYNDESNSNPSSPSDNQANKRKPDGEDSPTKRLRAEIEENFVARDRILNDFLDIADVNSVDQIQSQTEQILNEIRTLNELAKEKEREWNNIIHLKKIKEELLIRMQRKKQIMLLSDKNEFSDILNESQTDGVEDHPRNNCQQSILKANLTSSRSASSDRTKPRSILPRPCQSSVETNGVIDFRQGRQRPVLDVQSIIADYRQRHPETVPRRGRRIRHSTSDTSSNRGSNNVLNFSSMSLSSGSQVRQSASSLEMNSELGLLLSTVGANRRDGSPTTNMDSLCQPHDSTSFKDMLVQFARLSQTERNELIQNAIKPPPPYPEVTVHPVPTTTAPPTNSLLHGILTKSPTKSCKTSFSPTLARLLTAPERAVSNNVATPSIAGTSTMMNPTNMSITEILSTSKARNEITITPVGTQYDALPPKASKSADDEEAEDSVDRLVIDESNEDLDGRKGDNNSETSDEIPQCQGCNQKPAQFVCAGCGNQWYCSRDCQVSSWDEHSEVCSG